MGGVEQLAGVVAGVVATTLFMLVMPFAWWYVIRQRAATADRPANGPTNGSTDAASAPR